MGYSINVLAPSNSAELAEALRDAAAAGRTIALAGGSTKRHMAGPVEPADVTVTTMSLRGVLQYEPRDLTISVGAGLSWGEFTRLLAENRQMVPLDPPFADGATVGGVISANCSGPRRRLYGTARDVVIGMTFATLEGKLVKSGGMVVKNVAGLDMAKLMIGSFGTLAAIAVVNFKVQPMPEVERSFLLPFDSLAAAIAARNAILKGQLQAIPHGCWRCAPAATRRRYNATRANLRTSPAPRHSRTRTSRPCGATWKTPRRVSWRRTRMARWCAHRVR
jgi:glycolate oxidase FAD binding subunit